MAASATGSSRDGASIMSSVAPSSGAARMMSPSFSGRASMMVGLLVPRVVLQNTRAALRVEVDHEHLLALGFRGDRKVEAERGFADAALLLDEAPDPQCRTSYYMLECSITLLHRRCNAEGPHKRPRRRPKKGDMGSPSGPGDAPRRVWLRGTPSATHSRTREAALVMRADELMGCTEGSPKRQSWRRSQMRLTATRPCAGQTAR